MLIKLPDEIGQKLLRYLFLLQVFALPLSQTVSAKILATCALAVVLFSKITFRDFVNRLVQNSWDALFYLVILLVGLVYSSDLVSGLKTIEVNLSLLAIPVIFVHINSHEKKNTELLFKSFIIGLAIACLVCITNAGVSFWHTKSFLSFFFYDLTRILDFQPTYFAYYLVFGITYCLYTAYYIPRDKTNTFYLILSVFFFLMLMLTGGQTAFISILLIFAFFILKFLIEDRSKEKQLVVSIIGLMLVSMFVITSINIGQRGLSLNDAWDRLILWESAIEATVNPLLGVGTGDYKSALSSYYYSHGLRQFASEGYNSHNQFIQLLFSNGLLGVLALIALLGRPLYLSIRYNNLFGVLLIYPFFIYGITEVFLGRYQGVVFFALIHQICILNIRPERSASEKPTGKS